MTSRAPAKPRKQAHGTIARSVSETVCGECGGRNGEHRKVDANDAGPAGGATSWCSRRPRRRPLTQAEIVAAENDGKPSGRLCFEVTGIDRDPFAKETSPYVRRGCPLPKKEGGK